MVAGCLTFELQLCCRSMQHQPSGSTAAETAALVHQRLRSMSHHAWQVIGHAHPQLARTRQHAVGEAVARDQQCMQHSVAAFSCVTCVCFSLAISDPKAECTTDLILHLASPQL